MKLLSLGMIRRLRIECDGKYLAADGELCRNCRAQITKQLNSGGSDWKQMNEIHRSVGADAFVRPAVHLVLCFRRGAAPAVALQLVMQGDTIDVKHIGRAALIPATFLQDS